MISTISRRGFLKTTGAAAPSIAGHRAGFAQQHVGRRFSDSVIRRIVL
jgi:hypothetical protein